MITERETNQKFYVAFGGLNLFWIVELISISLFRMTSIHDLEMN